MLADLLRGGCVGSVSVTAVTPIMNFTNHVLAMKRAQALTNNSASTHMATRFTLRRAFDGVLSYNASVVPMIATSLYLNAFFMKQAVDRGYEADNGAKIFSATSSGMIAGMLGALPEGVAQAQQLNTPKPGALSVVRNIVSHNGFFALGRGVMPTMVRQGIFTVGYMGLMPYLSASLHERIKSPFVADLFSASLSGLVIGPVTAPWNMLRFERQKNFEQPGSAQSYSSIIRKAFDPRSPLSLMTGWKPRTLMSACSMLILHKGKEVYDHAFSERIIVNKTI